MSVTSLVTGGYICYSGQPIPVPAPISLDKPDIVGAVEVRPKIRRVTPPAEPPEKPTVTSVQELRPIVSGRATLEPQSSEPPKTTSAQELRPKITDAKEEE